MRDCLDYAKKNNIHMIGNYIDRALSATTDKRPEFQKMIKDSDKHLFDVVLVWKLDRFSRNRYDSATYKARLRRNGVRVISVMENISDEPEGILVESLLEGMAEYYSAELSQKNQQGACEKRHLSAKPPGATLHLVSKSVRINAMKLTRKPPLSWSKSLRCMQREFLQRIYSNISTGEDSRHHEGCCFQ